MTAALLVAAVALLGARQRSLRGELGRSAPGWPPRPSAPPFWEPSASGRSRPAPPSVLHSRAASRRLRCRRPDGVLPRHARPRRRADPGLRVALLRLRAERQGHRRPYRRVRSHARRGPVRARPDHVPRGLGADDAASGGADPRRPLRRACADGRSSSTSRSPTSPVRAPGSRSCSPRMRASSTALTLSRAAPVCRSRSR